MRIFVWHRDITQVNIFPPKWNWYIQLTGDSSYVPMNPSESTNGLAKITFKITLIKDFNSVILSRSQSKSYSHAYKYSMVLEQDIQLIIIIQ